MPFQSTIATVVTSDGHNFKAAKPIGYTSRAGVAYVIPAGASTDGASVPQTFWNILPPFGDYWLAAFLHDAAYQNTLQVFRDGAWAVAHLTKDESDSLFLEAMESLGVCKADAKTLYEGVHLFGWKAFREDRA